MIIPKRERILLPPERKRDKQLKIWVSQEELDMIHEKMADFGTRHMGAFIRKLVIDGYVIKLEIPELKEILHQLGPIGNNVNQLAAQAHSLHFVDPKKLKEEAERWHKFQADVERQFLRPDKCDMKWQ